MGLFLVYEQIINYYKEKISNGELVAGDELEAENVIAELFEVSRGTVRKALRYLKENGIISTERGKKLRDTICKKMNFTSLEFQSLEGIIKAIGLPKDKLCTYCWNGKE